MRPTCRHLKPPSNKAQRDIPERDHSKPTDRRIAAPFVRRKSTRTNLPSNNSREFRCASRLFAPDRPSYDLFHSRFRSRGAPEGRLSRLLVGGVAVFAGSDVLGRKFTPEVSQIRERETQGQLELRQTPRAGWNVDNVGRGVILDREFIERVGHRGSFTSKSSRSN